MPEMKLKSRKELGKTADHDQQTKPKTLRNKIIAEKLRPGISVEQLSQALHVRASTIRRVMEKRTQQKQHSTLQQAV